MTTLTANAASYLRYAYLGMSTSPPYSYPGFGYADDAAMVPSARLSVLDRIALECEAEAFADFFKSRDGRWFLLQTRWKLEDARREAILTFQPGRLRWSRGLVNYAQFELLLTRQRLDSWVEDPRRLFSALTEGRHRFTGRMSGSLSGP